MNYDRMKHSIAVANKMVDIGKKRNLTEESLRNLFLLGIVHDIGYKYGNNKDHNLIGSEILKNNQYKYWKEVYYHGRMQNEYKSEYLDILNNADMQIDKEGNDIGFDKRLEDIKNRYGTNSCAFNEAKLLIEELKKSS